MIYAAGIDVGSTQTKGVIINERFEIVGRALIDTGANVTRAAERSFVEALLAAGLKREDTAYVIGTGYGRYKVTFGDAQITEISCHAKGAFFLFPRTRTVIDMGGQDAKGIKVGEAPSRRSAAKSSGVSTSVRMSSLQSTHVTRSP